MKLDSLSIKKLLVKYWLEASIGLVALVTLIVGIAVSQSGHSSPAGSVAQSAPQLPGNQVSRLLPGTTTYSLDSMAYGKVDRVVTSEKVHHPILQDGDSLTIRGWAVDSPHSAAASSVVVQVDSITRVSQGTLYERPDVPKVMKNSNYLNSGYSIIIPASVLPLGRHTLSILVGDAAQTGYYLEPDRLTVTVLKHAASKN
jgi:hypothetical protein